MGNVLAFVEFTGDSLRTNALANVAFARKAAEFQGGEVILAGGAVGSPHLLLLSGIGPGAHLQDHGIEVRSDVPGVGEGVRDHPKTWITWRLKDDVPGQIGDPMLQLSARYTATDSDLRGDMMLYPNSIVPGAAPGTRDFRIEAVNNLQLSSGRLSLRSTDPDDRPAIDLGLLSEPRDRQRLVDAVERSLALADTSAMRDVVGDVVLPDVADPTDSEQVAEYVEQTGVAAAWDEWSEGARHWFRALCLGDEFPDLGPVEVEVFEIDEDGGDGSAEEAETEEPQAGS